MRLRHTAAALAVMALGTAHADDGFDYKFSGFGTLGAVHSDARQADFVANFFQPNGAGVSRSVSIGPDTKLGGQADVKFGDKLSAVVQVVSQHQYDNSYTPRVEWANAKYQVTPEFALRLGRFASPLFMMSQTVLVGYANPSVRPPSEVYGQLPLTSTDGIDATYRNTIGTANNTFNAFYGIDKVKLPGGGDFKSSPAWGVNDAVEFGSLTLRASFFAGNWNLNAPGVNALLAGVAQFSAAAGAVPLPAYQSAAAQAAALADRYRTDVGGKIFAFGAAYDPGAWFISAEFGAQRPSGFLFDANAWYVNGGYRFGTLTPYATYAWAKAKPKVEPGISTVGADPLAAGAGALNGGINAVINAFAVNQTSVLLGLRWDFMTNLALKTEYQRISLGGASNGRLGNVQPGFVPGTKVNVVTVAVDFVF